MACVLIFDILLTLNRRAFFPNLIDIVIEADRFNMVSELRQTNRFLKYLTRPEPIPEEATEELRNNSASLPFAPKSRSAFAFSEVQRGSNLFKFARRKSNLPKEDQHEIQTD